MKRVKKIWCWNNNNTEENENVETDYPNKFNDSQSQDSDLKLVIPQESLKKDSYSNNATSTTTPEPSAGIHRNSHTSSPLYSRHTLKKIT
jgi:hypothetical protein